MAKKDFAWDTQIDLGEVKETDKVSHEVALCTLGGKEFVATTKKVLGTEGWKIVKRQNFSRDTFDQIAALVQGEE